MSVEVYVYVVTMDEEVEVDAVPDRNNEESIENTEKYPADIGTTYEEVEVTVVPYQNN